MKAKLFNADGTEAGEVELPSVFETPIREDIIRRAFLAIMSHSRQPYGADPLAGLRSSAHYHGRRKIRWSMMNREMARLPRIHGKVGYLQWRVRVVPQAVKGRKAHPPVAEKNFRQKINRKERLLALKSAIAATANIELVRARGHKASVAPIIASSDVESFSKTSQVVKFLESAGLSEELERAAVRKVRAGKGKMRGRKYKKRKGPLFVVSGGQIEKAARNIPGVDVVRARNLNVRLLAPGGVPGRLTIFTEQSLSKIEELWGVNNG